MAAFCVKITDSPAVCYNDAVESPLLSQDLDQKLVTSAARLAFVRIVCAHNLLDISSFHQTLECIEIGLVEVTPGYFLYVEYVAFIFRTAVDGEMLEAGVKLVILLSGVTLKAVNDRTERGSFRA